MSDINERPVCHRAEDLVTYLNGEPVKWKPKTLPSLNSATPAAGSLESFAGARLDMLWRDEALAQRSTRHSSGRQHC